MKNASTYRIESLFTHILCARIRWANDRAHAYYRKVAARLAQAAEGAAFVIKFPLFLLYSEYAVSRVILLCRAIVTNVTIILRRALRVCVCKYIPERRTRARDMYIYIRTHAYRHTSFTC